MEERYPRLRLRSEPGFDSCPRSADAGVGRVVVQKAQWTINDRGVPVVVFTGAGDAGPPNTLRIEHSLYAVSIRNP